MRISAMRQKLHRILRKEHTKSTRRHNVFVCQKEILRCFSMICTDQIKIAPAKALNCCSFFLSFKSCLRKRGKNKMCSNGRAVCHHKTCLLKAQFPLIRWQLQKQNVHTDAWKVKVCGIKQSEKWINRIHLPICCSTIYLPHSIHVWYIYLH